jgi:two-component system, OmpR family, response regulator
MVPPSMRILILEDDPNLASALADAMRQAGHEPTSFGHAGLALGAIARGRFELLVCDVMLPNVGGVQAMRMARSQFPYLPIIAMSGNDDPNTQQECLDAGASRFFQKPLSFAELLDELRLVKDSQVDLEVGVVDSDRAHLERVTHELTSLGCQTHRFDTFAAVVESAPKLASLSVLLVDASLPDAVDAMAWGAERKLAAVAFGDETMKEDVLMRGGASFCMQKPIDSQSLVTQARFFVSPAPRAVEAAP